MTLSVAAAVIGGAIVGGAAINSKSASKATRAQTNASRDAISAGKDAETRALEMQRPFREAGYAATAAAMDMTGLDRGRRSAIDTAFNPETGAYEATGGGKDDLSSYAKYDWKTDPGYQFRRDEGQRVLERSRAADGIFNSGGTGRALVRYGQEYASNEYQKVYDRLSQMAGFGSSAASQGAQTVVNTGANTGNALMNAGAARASGYVAQGNAWSNAIGQVGMAAGGFGSSSTTGGTTGGTWTNRAIAVGAG